MGAAGVLQPCGLDTNAPKISPYYLGGLHVQLFAGFAIITLLVWINAFELCMWHDFVRWCLLLL
jgi:hypothetical protein